MHQAAYTYVADQVAALNLDGGDVLDLGGRDVNGTTRQLFPRAAQYITVDIAPHPSVDIIADAAELDLPDRFNVVVSTSCLEHTDKAAEIIATAFRHLAPGGTFVATMAGPGWPPHGAAGEQWVPAGEFYRNVTVEQLEEWLEDAGFEDHTVELCGSDLFCTAWR